jgi:peptide subunit release factor 1 (eRF1)
MHSGVKESEIKEIIEKAEENLKNSKNNIVCIFFDEINTASILSRMKEIFVNHSLN